MVTLHKSVHSVQHIKMSSNQWLFLVIQTYIKIKNKEVYCRYILCTLQVVTISLGKN